MKEFTYRVPAMAVRLKGTRKVQAWQTDVPGLVIQRWIEGDGFALTHRYSGFIIRNSEDRESLETLVGRLQSVPIDWSVKQGWEIMAQAAKLTDASVRLMTEILNGIRTKHAGKWRAACAARATKRGFRKWWKENR